MGQDVDEGNGNGESERKGHTKGRKV
jgi:hypothetical protein